MSKKIIYGDEAFKALLSGANKVYDSVKITLGPKGENVIIDNEFNKPLVTNDGVTIAKEITLEDPFEEVGAKVIIEAAEKTQEEAGDGTSTAVVLTAATLNNSVMFLNNINRLKFKDKLLELRDELVNTLEEYTIDINSDQMIEQVATISANNDPVIGKHIASAIKSVGRDGIINVEEAITTKTHIHKVDGMKINTGFISPYFINNEEALSVEYEDAYIVLINKKVFQVKDIMNILQKAKAEGKAVLFICDNMDGEALSALIVNKVRGGLRVAAVRVPGIGNDKVDNLEDIAAMTGATVLSEVEGIKIANQDLSIAGTAKKIIITKDSTIIREGGGDPERLQKRIRIIKAQLEKAESDFERQKLRKRLASLSTGVAILKVGAGSEIEMKEKKLRIDDALNATKAALDEGILPGGGVVLYMLGKKLLDQQNNQDDDGLAAIRTLGQALQAPLEQLIRNSGGSISPNKSEISIINDYFDNVKDISDLRGINIKTNEPVSMVEAGIIDPTKVVKSALKNAVTVAAMLISTGCIIGSIKSDDDNSGINGFNSGQMGMM